MADDVEPPDKCSSKTFKCHPKIKTNFVVCIICEEVYHISDFNRLKNVRYLSDILVICNVHQNLTSNQDETTLSDEARQIIGEIKLNESERVQEKLYNEVEKTISLNRRDYHDNTMLKEVDPDMRSIITQNILLKQLNEEIRSKNTLLENTIELMKNNKPIMYSEITKSNNKIKKQVKVPDIKISNKTENIDAESAFKKIMEVLQNDIVIPFKKVINTKKVV